MAINLASVLGRGKWRVRFALGAVLVVPVIVYKVPKRGYSKVTRNEGHPVCTPSKVITNTNSGK